MTIDSDPISTVQPESIRRRYAATLLGQFFQFGVAAITASFVPRILGPADYGNYNFLLNTSQAIRNFLEPSVQQAFFTFSSQDRESGPLTKLYGLVLLAQFVVILSLIGLSALVGFTHLIWPGQALDQIVWITVLDWVLFIALVLRQIGDSKGLTIRPQAISVATSGFTLVGLVALVALRKLDIYAYVALNLCSASIACIALGRLLLVRHRDLCWVGELRGRVRGYVRRWWRYAVPVIALEYLLPLMGYVSTYLLQLWYGSNEQGLFSLAYRWSALVMVFSSAATMIVWREIAQASAAGERERAAYVYLRFNRLLFTVTVTLCVWLSFSGGTLVIGLAGEQYRAAVPVFMIMAFYPLQQTYGQLNTIALKAAERTAYFRNLTILVAVPDLLLSYFLLAPTTVAVPGLGWGAIGIAVRLVGYGLISIQIFEWANFRFFGLNYTKVLFAKLVAAAVVGTCGGMTLLVLRDTLQTQLGLKPIVSLAISSSIYFALIGMAIIARPDLLGMNRDELVSNLRAVRRKALAAIRIGSRLAS